MKTGFFLRIQIFNQKMQKSLDLGTESKIGEIFRNWELSLQQKKKILILVLMSLYGWLNKLSKRNIIDDQRVYTIGKRYKEKKKNQLVRINIQLIHVLSG